MVDREVEARMMQRLRQYKDETNDKYDFLFQGKRNTSVTNSKTHSEMSSTLDSARNRYQTKDLYGNPVMTGVDYRSTSLHYNKGITMDKMNVREK